MRKAQQTAGVKPMTRQGRIIFLPVPERLRNRLEEMAREHAAHGRERHGGEHEDGEHESCGDDADLSINPDIPIPVEIPEGAEKLNPEELSREMILSGMLRVIASGEEKPEWIGYYRQFVLASQPRILEEFTEAAILKARNGDFDMALEILDVLRGLFPVSPVPLLNRALTLEEKAALLERQGKSEAAAAHQAAAGAYEEVLALEPPFPAAHFNGGFFFMGQKDFRRARECFCRYLEIAEESDGAGKDDEEGKKERAESIIREIEESGLEDKNFREACELIRQGQETKGLEKIRNFLERRPSVWNGWFMLGWALRRLSRWEDGAAAFGKAVEFGGGNSDTRNELAICLMETGDYPGARRELETALREDPENVKIISNLGVLAMRNGNDEEAAAFFRTVLALEPDDPVAGQFFDPENI
ncbi:MAG: tetratricopeptide repeat protein [Treponema sp.]|jgi:tetratricopeptide (TPR) repeat protein|nr:tetratricopeptide repeat protein [Treponema sp.]